MPKLTRHKVVSKAFQVLSDPQKRQIFDQTGADPDSRGGGGGGGGGGGFAGGNPFAAGGQRGPEVSAEEIFNMFFGGMGGAGMGGMGGMGGGLNDFFGDAPTFQFGPGIRVQQFGGGGPRMRRRQPAAAAEGEEEAPVQNLTRIFWQLAPLILFFLLPMLSGLFGGDGSAASSGPKFSMEPNGLYTQQRFTPAHNVPFYVNPKEVEKTSVTDDAVAQFFP